MRDLIIGKDVAYGLSTATGDIAGAWAVDLLTEGGISMMGDDGAHIAHDASAIDDVFVTFAVKTPNGVKTTFPIYKDGCSFSKLAYVAPVKAVKYVGSDQAGSAGNYSLNLPSALAVGDVVGIGIVNLAYPVEDTRRYKEYTHTVVTGDLLTGTTAKNIIVILAALINADVNRAAVATVVEDGSSNVDGLKLTAVTAGVDFAIYHVDGVLKDSDIVEYHRVNKAYASGSTTAVKSNPGQGTYADILELYKETASRDGNSQFMKFQDLLWTDSGLISSATTYTTYVIRTKVPNTDAIAQSINPPLELVIAVPSGATSGEKVVTVLDALLALLIA